jgi:hypothetical protein
MERKLENNLVISHGRNHRHIKEIEYDTSVFVDPNPEANADYNYIKNAPNPKRKFDNIILAHTPSSLIISSIVIDSCENIIDGELNPKIFNECKKRLSKNGHIYTKPEFELSNGDYNRTLFNTKMRIMGFAYINDECLTFDKSIQLFGKYKMVSIPTYEQHFDNLIEMIRLGNVRCVNIKYYSDTFGKKVVKRLNVTNLFNKSKLELYEILLPENDGYGNVGPGDCLFVYPSDFTKLSCTMIDDSVIKFF